MSVALVDNKFLRTPSKILFHMKKICCQWLVTAQNLQPIQPIWLSKSNEASIARVVALFPQASRLLPAPTSAESTADSVLSPKRPVFVLAYQTGPSCAWVLPPELDHWFCSQNFLLSSGIALGNNCQMTCRGLNLDSNLNSAAWPTRFTDFMKFLSAPKTLNKLC